MDNIPIQPTPSQGQPYPLSQVQGTQAASSSAPALPPYTPNIPLYSAEVSLADAVYFLSNMPPTPAGQQPSMETRMGYRVLADAIINFNNAFQAQYSHPSGTPVASNASPFAVQIEADITTPLDSNLDPRLPPPTNPPTTLLSLAENNPSGLVPYIQAQPPIVFPSADPIMQSLYPNGQTLQQTLSPSEALSPTQQPPGFGTSLPPSSTGQPNATMLQLQDFYQQFEIITNPKSTPAQQDAAMDAAANDIIAINATLTSLGGAPPSTDLPYGPPSLLDPMCQLLYWSMNATVGRDPNGNPISLVQAAEDIVDPPSGSAPDYSTFQSILVGNEQFIDMLDSQVSLYYYTLGYGNTPIYTPPST